MGALAALEVQGELVLRIPTNQRLDLVQFETFRGTGNRAGRYRYGLSMSVSNLDSNPGDPCAPLSRRRGNFHWTLIHEFGHLRDYLHGSIDRFTPAFRSQSGSGTGYLDEGSPRLDGTWVSSYAERAGGDEDCAESFRPRDDALFVESECLGDFSVQKISP